MNGVKRAESRGKQKGELVELRAKVRGVGEGGMGVLPFNGVSDAVARVRHGVLCI